MGGEIGTASVKGKLAPSATESRPTAVPVLQIKQPMETILKSGAIFKG
jgi:hypothetical protein